MWPTVGLKSFMVVMVMGVGVNVMLTVFENGDQVAETDLGAIRSNARS